MTGQEAERLTVGCVVQTRVRGRWTKVEVLGVGRITLGQDHWVARLTLRRPGRTTAGTHFPVISRFNNALRESPDLDPASANVYADWLDDHGEHRAAGLLRGAFPLGPG